MRLLGKPLGTSHGHYGWRRGSKWFPYCRLLCGEGLWPWQQSHGMSFPFTITYDWEIFTSNSVIDPRSVPASDRCQRWKGGRWEGEIPQGTNVAHCSDTCSQSHWDFYYLCWVLQWFLRLEAKGITVGILYNVNTCPKWVWGRNCVN